MAAQGAQRQLLVLQLCCGHAAACCCAWHSAWLQDLSLELIELDVL
jgi:hypothetical protein